MKRQNPISNFLIVFYMGLCILSMSLNTIFRMPYYRAYHDTPHYSYYAVRVYFVSGVTLLLLGIFCMLPQKIKVNFLQSSWLRKHTTYFVELFGPGLGIGFMYMALLIFGMIVWAIIKAQGQ